MTSNDDPNRIDKQAHRYAEYEAQDQNGEQVGHVDDLFVNTVNGQEYVELNMGVLGLRSTIVPLEICRVDEKRKLVAIPQSKTKLKRAPRKRAPLLGDEVMAITPEYEDRIRAYFGLEPAGPRKRDRLGPSRRLIPREVRSLRVRFVSSRPGSLTEGPWNRRRPLPPWPPGRAWRPQLKPSDMAPARTSRRPRNRTPRLVLRRARRRTQVGLRQVAQRRSPDRTPNVSNEPFG